MLRDYYQLAKPGIVYGNLTAALAGFFFASPAFWIPTLFALIIGLGLTIGSACVFNNYLDRDMDALMERTRKRGFAAGTISPHAGLAYGTVLGMIGMLVLWKGTNPAASFAALLGFAVYVFLYTPLKRRTPHATLIGAVAGAMPIVVGYTASISVFDVNALTLFLMLALWQMPHFYAIAIYRKDEYAAAHVPVVSLVRDVPTTVLLARIYAALFACAVVMPGVIGSAGYTYASSVFAVSAWWLFVVFQPATEPAQWGRRVFRASLAVLVVTCVALSLSALLP